MADVKWIKITTDMFDNRKIRHLRRLPDGNNIVLIWVMLLTMAGRCNANGMIFLTENIPYTPKMLADELDFEENTVILALEALGQLNMIVTESGYFTIAGWEEYQNIEGMDKIREQNRLRQKRKREKQKTLLIGDGKTCEYCGEPGSTVDHIIALTKGGYNIPENTVCACLECNMQKTNRDVAAFLNEKLSEDKMFDVNRILANEKIMKVVLFDGKQFLSRDITGQVTACHATDKERDKEKEEDKKSVRENTHTLFQRLRSDYIIDDLLEEKLSEWFKYKVERKEGYKEQGMKALLRQIENQSQAHGSSAICKLIDESMSNGWKGIIFDRLSNQKNQANDKKGRLDWIDGI